MECPPSKTKLELQHPRDFIFKDVFSFHFFSSKMKIFAPNLAETDPVPPIQEVNNGNSISSSSGKNSFQELI